MDLSNYPTKVDLEKATGADTSKFAKNIKLAISKSDIDKLDIDKLKNEKCTKQFNQFEK